jgi:nitroreductase
MDSVVSVSQALQKRKSVRAFLQKPVDTTTILTLLEKSARAPSGGNLQPWRVAVVNGEAMARFQMIMEARLAGEPSADGEPPEYSVYPPGLKEPYRTSRFRVGEQMYAIVGISREDRPARLAWFANNYRFFGAPAAIFCFVDRIMGPPQWSDLGMFLQSFMLLAAEAGLCTCPQEAWSQYPRTVATFCGMEPELMLFCGVAIGYGDESAPVNGLASEREPLSQWVKVV